MQELKLHRLPEGLYYTALFSTYDVIFITIRNSVFWTGYVLDWVFWTGCSGLGVLDWVFWTGCFGLDVLDQINKTLRPGFNKFRLNCMSCD